MKNFKVELKTVDIINSIKSDVNSTIIHYNAHKENWREFANMAFYQFKTLCLVSFKKQADFSEAYDELSELTDFRELFKYNEIASFINSKF